MNFFRYVENSEVNCVELRLFKAADGRAHADVSGPIVDFPNQAFSDVVELVRCSSLDDAFEAGIRMANKSDTELVVSGSPELWMSKWGTLDRSPTPPGARDHSEA